MSNPDNRFAQPGVATLKRLVEKYIHPERGAGPYGWLLCGSAFEDTLKEVSNLLINIAEEQQEESRTALEGKAEEVMNVEVCNELADVPAYLRNKLADIEKALEGHLSSEQREALKEAIDSKVDALEKQIKAWEEERKGQSMEEKLRHLLIKQENSNSLKAFSADLVAPLWYHFAYSLITGEFIENIEYSKTMNEIGQAIRTTLEQNMRYDSYHIHPVFVSLLRLCDEVVALCELLKVQLKIDSSGASSVKRVIVAYQESSNFYTYVKGPYCLEQREAASFYDLGTRLIGLTKLDMCYTVDAHALRQMMALHSLCQYSINAHSKKASGNAPQTATSGALPFLKTDLVYPTIEAIRVKTSLLLWQVLYRPRLNAKGLLNLKGIWPFRRYKETLILFHADDRAPAGGNPSKGYHDREIEKVLQADLSTLSRVESSQIENDHVDGYNAYVESSNKAREEDGDLRERSSPSLSDILKRGKKILEVEEKEDRKPLESILLVLERMGACLEKEDKEEGVDRAELLDVFNRLLNSLQQRVEDSRNYTMPYQKCFPYTRSKYMREDSLPIFISSYGAYPLNLENISESKIPKLKLIRMKMIAKDSKQAADAVNSANQALQSASDKFVELEQKASESRKESMTLMSIFSAVVLFLGVGASVFKDTEMGLGGYLIMFGTIYILIALMASFLYFRKFELEYWVNERLSVKIDKGTKAREEGDKKAPKRTFRDYWLDGTVALWLSILVAGGLICLGWRLVDRENQQNTTTEEHVEAVIHPEVNVVIDGGRTQRGALTVEQSQRRNVAPSEALQPRDTLAVASSRDSSTRSRALLPERP